jgi:hypothetical protein
LNNRDALVRVLIQCINAWNANSVSGKNLTSKKQENEIRLDLGVTSKV